MISVAEAKQLISQHVKPGTPFAGHIGTAAGFVLATDLYASRDIPAFPQSSMDGYSFNFEGFVKFGKLKITGEMAAGSSREVTINQNEAARIFTGAPLPKGADTVVMQEKTTLENEYLIISDDKITTGAHMRKPGSEIKAGALAMKAGTLLTPAAIGFLAGIGISEMEIYPDPKVHIIHTGNELQQPGEDLQRGMVYESNSFSLKAALSQWGVKQVTLSTASDTLNDVLTSLKNIPPDIDFLLLTGGISVGDYDFVLEAATNAGVEKIFHRISQKPGKPLFFGKKNDTVVFGLPGNPASVLTCFFEYVSSALEIFMHKKPKIKTQPAVLQTDFKKPAGLTHFMKAYFDGSSVSLLDAQESYRLSSFATANCFIVAEESAVSFKSGDLVTIHILPDNT